MKESVDLCGHKGMVIHSDCCKNKLTQIKTDTYQTEHQIQTQFIPLLYFPIIVFVQLQLINKPTLGYKWYHPPSGITEIFLPFINQLII